MVHCREQNVNLLSLKVRQKILQNHQRGVSEGGASALSEFRVSMTTGAVATGSDVIDQ